jgi:Mg2+ and Co2+ transporter CorA
VTTIGLVIVDREKAIVTISKAENRFFEPILADLTGSATAEGPLAVRVLYGLLDRINEAYARILSEMESGMIQLESTPNNEMPENFLDSVFQLKRVTSVLVTSLFHQKTVTAIVARSIPPTGPWAGQKSIFDALTDESVYLHETAGNIREGLLSLIDVHINTVSYEMNRAMRVIAVLSALVLIPTLIGQVLGMNILETPFELYLWEVTTWTIISMLVVGWIFYRLGWLR